MNRIIIVGNGFDLAHNLKTSYSDFIYSYLTECLQNVSENGAHEDCLWLIQATNVRKIPVPTLLSEGLTFQKMLDRTKEIGYMYTYRSNFFKQLCTNLGRAMWVDIEHLYYYFLRDSINTNGSEVPLINTQLDFLKTKLIQYIKNNALSPKISNDIVTIFKENLRNPWEIKTISDLTNANPIDKTYILNFNYTNTVSNYVKEIASNQIEQIQIHGNIDNPESVVFGFGDELDKDYQAIEDLNNNEYFKHIKSFKYLQDNTYQHLIHVIEDDFFEVYVMGHSLGISDRTLLSQIFQSTKLTSVRLFYYVKTDGTNDFIEKTHEISRHFKNKGRMRMRVVPFTESRQHPQL